MYILKRVLLAIFIVLPIHMSAKETKGFDELNNTAETQECIVLNRVDLDENIIFDQESQNEVLSFYYGKCISSLLLKELVNEVSTYYLDKAYITTKAFLKPQDINDGQVDISVSKGFIEDIIDSDSNSSNWKIKSAFIFQKDELLNLRDLETSLEMLNRVPSTSAKFKIFPGNQIGSSIIKIDESSSFPLRFTLGASGEKTVEEYDPQANVELAIDNLVNINDILSLRYNSAPLQEDYQSNDGLELNYSFSLGSYLWEYTWFNITYDREVLGDIDTYNSSGDTTGSKLRVSKVLLRDQSNKLNLAFSIHHKNTKNYFQNELIEVSSYRTTLAQVNLSHTYMQEFGQIYTTYSYQMGTDWFGARDDNYFSAQESQDEARLQFSKHTLNANIIYYLGDRSYQYNPTINIQYSKDKLYDNNKLAIGSFYSIRGYNASYYGNSGWYIKNDFIKTLYLNLNRYFLQTLSLFVGVDYGGVKCEEDNAGACGKLFGSAIGFRINGENFGSNLTWSRAMNTIEGIEKETLLRYDINIKF